MQDGKAQAITPDLEGLLACAKSDRENDLVALPPATTLPVEELGTTQRYSGLSRYAWLLQYEVFGG